MDVLHSQRWCVFVTLLFWCVVEILSRSPRVCLHAELLFLLKPNLLHVRQKYWHERNFHMNECFQINLGCYGSVRACVRARATAYLRDAEDAALELLMMLQKSSSNKALRWNMLSARWTTRAQTTKQVQAGSRVPSAGLSVVPATRSRDAVFLY